MLRLPQFRHHAPEGLNAAVALVSELLARGDTVKLIAGGTDLVPNLKHEITTPAHVVSLRRCGLDGIEVTGDALVLGAMTPVQTVADDPRVRQRLPALADACGQIAGPQLRRMGTIGGNVCLDTRCLYINQSHFWRQALGFCLKKDGTACHVVAGGRNCVAAASNDSALPLMLYGAELTLVSVRGSRRLALDDFYVADGIKNTVLEPDEILTTVHVPLPGSNVGCAFEKLRLRRAIDFPLLNVCARADRDAAGLPEHLDVVVSALGARPKRLAFDKQLRGRPLDEAAIAEAARRAHTVCRPLTNIATAPEWRRAMVSVLVRRALRRLRDGTASALA